MIDRRNITKKDVSNMEELKRELAIKYERYKCQFDKIHYTEIEKFSRDVNIAFNVLTNNLTVKYVDFDPYNNVEEMTADIETNKVLKISSLFNESKIMDAATNLRFRAIHDYLHYVLQAPFTFAREYEVYKLQSKLHGSKVGKDILYSEINLQAAYAEYFGRFAEKEKVILGNIK